MSNPQLIEDIRRKFRNEWLLIAIDSIDESTTRPLKGTLVDHASSPEPLWEKASKLHQEALVVFSDDWPDDLAACFTNGNLSDQSRQC